MLPEHWRRVEELFHEAWALPVSVRAAFLASASPDDEVLREEVESLLADSDVDDEFLDGAAGHLSQAITDALVPPSLTGRSLGPYRIQDLLGIGGMSEVYRARDTRLERDVAIKILPPEFTANIDRRARFEREARVLAALNHPNICGIYGLEEEEAVRFLVLELVEGRTLAALLSEDGRTNGLSTDEALRLARQIAVALEIAHERGIVHRDLKPANIGVTPDGIVKVLDFGLAKAFVGDGTAKELTQVPVDPAAGGAVMGTAAYMSPEQARGLPVDKRTDIWAFGCVVFEMLTGVVAFGGETFSDSVARILEREPDWSLLPVGTPASVRRMLQRCLIKDPRQRMRDIGDARLDLDASEERAAAPLATSPGVAPSVDSKWGPWVALAALAAGLLVWESARPSAPVATPLADARFTRLTDWSGNESGAEISPDGRLVAFESDRDGQYDLWVTELGTGKFVNLTQDLPPLAAPGSILRSFGFSGDNKEIWFSGPGDPSSPKLLVPVGGGTPRPFLGQNVASPTWSPAGDRLVYFVNGDGDPVYVAGPDGSNPQRLFVDQDGTHNHNPVWSSDGKWIYFARGLDPTEQMDIWRLLASGSAPERVTTQSAAVNFLAPLDPRTVLYLARSADRSGPWLWAADVERGTSTRVAAGLDAFTSLSASRDGRTVVATVTNPSASLWSVPLNEGRTEESDARPFALPTARALAPRYVGDSLLYLSTSQSGDGLWRFRNQEASLVFKDDEGGLFEPPAASPDGRHIAVVVRRQGVRRLMLMDADGKNGRMLPDVEVQGSIGQSAADWSPDSRTLVVGGADQRGPGLFSIPVAGGPALRLFTGVAVNPLWSPKGDQIIYAGPFSVGQVTLSALKPDGGQLDFPPLKVRPGGYRFTPDGAGLIYQPFIPSMDFWRLDLATQVRRQVAQLDNRGTLKTFDIAPDGSQIVFDRSRENADVVVIQPK